MGTKTLGTSVDGKTNHVPVPGVGVVCGAALEKLEVSPFRDCTTVLGTKHLELEQNT